MSSIVDVDDIKDHPKMTALVSSELKKFHNTSSTVIATTAVSFRGRVEDQLNSSNVLSSNRTDESSDNITYQDSTSSLTMRKSCPRTRPTKKRKTHYDDMVSAKIGNDGKENSNENNT